MHASKNAASVRVLLVPDVALLASSAAELESIYSAATCWMVAPSGALRGALNRARILNAPIQACPTRQVGITITQREAGTRRERGSGDEDRVRAKLGENLNILKEGRKEGVNESKPAMRNSTADEEEEGIRRDFI
ncbi:hypothetical protein B0H11DRAFT_1930797 [Mycena galericulata]|nr:hypothetical protein B0H11DRAFT_1930797 [Mycena galericulata]